MANRKMSAKQIAIFGTKAQKAALKRRRTSSRGVRRARSSSSRGPTRVTTRRTTNMARRTRRSRGKKSKASIADIIVSGNTAFQMAEPFKDVAAKALSGDLKGAAEAAPDAFREAASFKNLGQTLGPHVALKLAKKLGAGRVVKGRFMGRRLV